VFERGGDPVPRNGKKRVRINVFALATVGPDFWSCKIGGTRTIHSVVTVYLSTKYCTSKELARIGMERTYRKK
jgi:hypothetical protein